VSEKDKDKKKDSGELTLVVMGCRSNEFRYHCSMLEKRNNACSTELDSSLGRFRVRHLLMACWGLRLHLRNWEVNRNQI